LCVYLSSSLEKQTCLAAIYRCTDNTHYQQVITSRVFLNSFNKVEVAIYDCMIVFVVLNCGPQLQSKYVLEISASVPFCCNIKICTLIVTTSASYSYDHVYSSKCNCLQQ
jgi:hypothetical protein